MFMKMPKTDKNNSMNSIITQLKNYWYLFIISFLLFTGCAYAYLKFATKQYLITSTLLLQQPATSPDPTSQFANAGVSSVLNDNNIIKNEGDVLRSRNLMKEVVQNMHLNIKYFNKSGLLAEEIYDESPFSVRLMKSYVDSLKQREYVISVLNDSVLNISNADEGVNSNVRFGKTLRLPQYNIEIVRRKQVPLGKEFSVKIQSEDDAITEMLGAYDAEFIDKATTTVGFTFYYPNSKKGEAILQNLMNRYLADNISNKKQNIDSTIDFINSRIAVVAAELIEIEKKYQAFRSSNNITDIAELSKVLVGDASTYEDRYQQQRIQLSIINSLKNKLNQANREIIPSSLNIQNASFAAGLAQYNNLINEREKSKLSYTETNPVVKNLDQQIQLAKRNLLESINSYQQEIELNTAGLNSQNQTVNNSIKSVPGKQRTMVDYGRQQELKQQLYIYLLQKREETAMAKAAKMPFSRVIDNAKSTKGPAKPLRSIVYLMSFFLGLVVPLGYVNSKSFFASRISSEADIEQQTDTIVIGKIGHRGKSEKYVVDVASRSAVIEGFRTLRTKLRNLLQNDQSNVIMVTSSMKGEGKTFLTCNLGNTLAITGKRVVMIELDLRQPKLSAALGIDHNKLGFSNYILEDLNVSDIIKPSNVIENCWVISSGPVVSNASELLLSDKLDVLIKELRANFDYILIDSSPVGLVSDALIIQKHTDITIFVCRHNYTYKNQIDVVNEIKTKDSVENLYMVINDVDYSKPGYSGYGYGLGYGEKVK
jgi:tyrosine-protein kinase Etk/Wzc